MVTGGKKFYKIQGSCKKSILPFFISSSAIPTKCDKMSHVLCDLLQSEVFKRLHGEKELSRAGAGLAPSSGSLKNIKELGPWIFPFLNNTGSIEVVLNLS